MPTIPTQRIHNVVLLGHNGSGKTTLAEALLHRTGAITRRGRVEDGTTVLDTEPEEQRRHASVMLGIAGFELDGHRVNLLDTPGLPDFFAEVELALPVADLAVIVISAVEGVEVQTEAAWNAAAALGVPRLLFINKLDAERADFERVIEQCREVFGSGVAPLELPVHDAGRFIGVADLLTDEAITYDDGAIRRGPIPEEMAELEHRVRDNLVEGIVVADDALTERYLDGDVPAPTELEETLANGIAEGTVFPVLCGSGLSEVAIDRLASFICEVTHHRAVLAHAGDGDVSIEPDPAAQPLARVFKTVVDPFVGRISLLQVCSGTLHPDAVLFNTRTRSDERLHVLQHLQGKNTSTISEAVAGDIIAVPKLNGARIGDTLAPRQSPVVLDPATISPPRLSIAIHPRTTGDDERLMTALHRLQEEDLALSVERDDETHQTVLSGLGDAHLQVALERLARKYNVEVEREELRVPYRETVTRPSHAEGRYKKQTGGHGQFGVAHLRIEPLERGSGFEFVDEIVGGAIPRQFIPAVEKGVRRIMREGGAFGFPVVDVRVVLDDGKFHSVDSSEASFEQAGALALLEALAGAEPIPLEPISRLEVRVPARFLGDVLADVNARRARVGSSAVGADGEQVIVAMVPTSEVTRYAADLRALTGGRGRFTLVHDHYDSVPGHLLDRFPRPRTLVS